MSAQPVVTLFDNLEPDSTDLMSADQPVAFQRALDDRERLEIALEELLERISFAKRACQLCGVEIRFIKFLRPGAESLSMVAVNYDGSFHDCKKKGVA